MAARIAAPVPAASPQATTDTRYTADAFGTPTGSSRRATAAVASPRVTRTHMPVVANDFHRAFTR